MKPGAALMFLLLIQPEILGYSDYLGVLYLSSTQSRVMLEQLLEAGAGKQW